MKIYIIFQEVNCGYDTYDSAIVIAKNKEDAKRTHPSEYYEFGEDDDVYFVYSDGTKINEGASSSGWCKLSDVQVQYIGEAKKGLKKGVIVASFNAG